MSYWTGMSEGRKKLPRFLSEEEVHRMFKAAEGRGSTRDLKILKLLYYFGLRNNEMCSLDAGHVNFRDMTLKVVQGKGRKDRIIPIIEINPLPDEDKTIADDLREWAGGSGKGALVEGGSKGRISDRHVRRIVKEYAARAEVRNYDEIHPHTLRHSYATHLTNLGVPMEVIQKLLGHRKTDTTLIYAHMGIENLRAEINKYVGIAGIRKEIPGILDAIHKERNVQKRIDMQQDLLIRMFLTQMGMPDATKRR